MVLASFSPEQAVRFETSQGPRTVAFQGDRGLRLIGTRVERARVRELDPLQLALAAPLVRGEAALAALLYQDPVDGPAELLVVESSDGELEVLERCNGSWTRRPGRRVSRGVRPGSVALGVLLLPLAVAYDLASVALFPVSAAVFLLSPQPIQASQAGSLPGAPSTERAEPAPGAQP